MSDDGHEDADAPDQRGETVEGLRSVAGAIVVSAILSTLTAFADALALAGLASRLTQDLGGVGETLERFDFLQEYPVIIGLIAVTLLTSIGNTLLREHTSTSWDARRREALIKAYREADYTTQTTYSGAALSAAVAQINRASGAIGALVGLLNASIRAAVYVGMSFVTSWQISTLVVVTGGTLVMTLRQLSRRTKQMHRRLAKLNVSNGENIGEMAISARELHGLARWDETEEQLSDETWTMQRLRFRSASLAGFVGPVYWCGTLMVGVAVASWSQRTGVATAGLATSGILLIRCLSVTQAAQLMFQSFNDSQPYVENTGKTIADLRRARRSLAEGRPPASQHLAVKTASLSYGSDVVVDRLDLELHGPGGIALVGPSGSGKSTTLLALSGLVAPASGEVRLGDASLQDIPTAALGATIGYLPQDPKLVRGSLRSNLTRPDRPVDDARIWEVLRQVGLEATVRGFGGDLEVKVGRAAEGFSGGELQRLGLARLLINQPDIWLVDEPTSALDRINSDRVLELLTSAMEDRLVVVVTHRPELLHSCKRIIYMRDGELVDDGPLDEVSARQPFVAGMLTTNAGADAAADG